MAKTYKCPYCNEKYIRDELVTHIEDKHEELLPKEVSPFHMVFDIVNNKKPIGDGHGVCVVCKRDTEWNENNAKYARLCGRQQCNDKLRESYSKNMIKVHGTDNLLNNAEVQEKMLANRKISGKYKFADGGYHTYTGSYEEKALEFEDKVLGFKSSEILSPGPTIEYEYKGETHKYITDQLIIPFNLIIEVKDGGGNTNGRINDDSRDRTLAKELAITNMGKYNYLRLTNNDFGQLLSTLVEIKSQMIDDSEDNKKVVININEEVEALKEMSTTNPLNPNFQKKEKLSLSSFKRIPVTEENVKKYKSQMPSLCHVRTGEEYKGYIYLDKNKVVGYIVVHDNGTNLREIQALEVAKDYRGCGLSKQLLYVLVHELKANATTVSRSNEITLKINKELGFRTVPHRGNDKMYYQTLGGKSVASILNESTIDTTQFEFISCPDPEDGVSRAQNSVVKVKGRQFRARVETLIVKDGKVYAQKLDKPNKYGYGCKFPGGGIEPTMSVEDSAQKECNEEARIVVDDLKYSGVSYIVDFNGEYPEWHKKKLWKYGLKYEGTVCYIFVGYYDKKYTGEVEKIDYDDLFKHGDFYEIDELDLLPEHKQALKSYGVLKESYISEGVTDLTFYHGSDKKLDEITPTSPNMGNKLEPAKWCCYLWKDKDRAIKFAVQKSLRNYRTELKNKGNEFGSIVYDVTNGKSMLLDTEYEDIKKLAIKANLKAYIHTVEAPLSTVGIGHASSIPEYTSTATLPVQKVDTVEIDSKIFDSVFEKGTEEDKNKLLDKALHSKARGVLAYLMNDQAETYKKEMKVKKAMKNGELSIGDDISVIIAGESTNVIGTYRYFAREDIEKYDELYSIDRCDFLGLLYEEVKIGNINKQDWEDIKTIYSSLNTQEKKFIGGVTNSPKVAFCKIYKEGTKPVAFARGFDFGRDEIIIEVCVASYARGKGYGVKAVNDCVSFTRMKKYEKAVYLVNKKNTASIALAKKCGFKLEMTKKEYFIYIIQTSKKVDKSTKVSECGGLAGGPGGMVGTQDLSVITQYGYKNSESDEVEGYAVHNDILTDNIVTVSKKGKVKKESMDFLQGRKIRMFEYVGENVLTLNKIVHNIGKQSYREYFYEAFTGRKLLSDDQILCDEDFKEISPTEMNESKNSKIQTIFAEFREIKGDPIMKFPLMNPLDIKEANTLIKGNTHVKIFENVNGYFAENTMTRQRTGYYKEIGKIQIGVIV